MCKKGTKYCGWDRRLPEFYKWRHICLVYDGFKDLYKLFVDGEKIESGEWTGDNAFEQARKGGILFLGQKQTVEPGGGFLAREAWSGKLSQFNIWNWPLEDFYIENAAECRSDLLGNMVIWNEESWTMGPKVLNNLIESESDEVKSEYFLFGMKFDYNFYSTWCVNQGGSIAIPSSAETYHEMMDIADALKNKDIHEKCFAGSGALVIWTGLNDEEEEGVWVNPYTKDPMTVEGLWAPGKPDGGRNRNCAKTDLGRKWKDATCDEGNCALCHFPNSINLTMRGLCGSEVKVMEGFFDLLYFIKGYVNLKPHWRGYGKSHIFFVPEKGVWRLESFYDTEKRAEFFATDENPYDYWPTGRSTWRINAGICQLQNVDKKLTLTDCISDDGTVSFTCNDGTCLDMIKRCDLAVDCPDSSDEKDCDVLRVPGDYRSQIFPIMSSGDPLLVTVNVTILAFPEIATLELSYTVDFILLMQWIDPRLQFYNLREQYDLNALSNTVQSKIWVPALSFPNARQAEGTVVDDLTLTRILKNGQPLPDDTSQAVEALIYEGVDSRIIMTREYFVKFNCDFDLVMYPFDTQICNMQLQVNGIPKKYIQMLVQISKSCPDCDGADYLGSRQLVEYVIGGNVMDPMMNNSEKTDIVRVLTVFKRKWNYHFWTIFVQSVILIGVAYMTFYFKLSNFQDRIMISITIMMVVATVQSSIVKMVPKTAYYKMIDYWLLYSFNIIIIIMIVHTIIDAYLPRDKTTNHAFNPRLKKTEEDSENDKIDLFGENPNWEPGWVKAYRINALGQILNILVFLIFNITFWSIALSHTNTDTQELLEMEVGAGI